ncbi:MAG TPA: hypothetical protein VEK37_13580 [Gemmatimonadaceae bacterium]|nr:hypothetical protein [Gemmatimonadaceae bacterium]
MSPSVPSPTSAASSDHQIRPITVDGQKFFVSLRVGYDGVEHIGRLLFTEASTEIVYQDHGGVPGINVMDAVRKAKEFTETQLEQRCYRALSEKRRFGRLRRATDQMISKIRHLNRVAVGLEKGLLDPQGGQLELDQAQNDLMEIVKTLRLHAGVEDEPD